MSEQYVQVEIGGKTRLLRYDYNAICDIEEKFGKGVAAIFSEEQVGFNTVRLFLWAGLKWKDPGLTAQRVGQWLQKEAEEGRKPLEFLNVVMEGLKKAKVIQEQQEEVENEGNE